MKFVKRVSLFLLICIITSCKQNHEKAIVPQIIPIPLSQEILEGEFLISAETQIISNETFKISTQFLVEYLSDFNLKISESEVKSNAIQFIKDETISNTEGYTLNISTQAIVISAKTDQGAFYAVQTLRQLLPEALEKGTTKEKQFAIQCIKIEDEPQFKYRGMHLDVGRHLFSTDFIKKYIDALAIKVDNTIDLKRTKELIELSKPMQFTFHRAFDWTPNPEEALKQLINLGVNRILTSGQNTSAVKGLKTLKRLNNLAENKISILPGGGISAENAILFKNEGFKEIHASLTQIKKVNDLPTISMNSEKHFTETHLGVSDSKKIQQLLKNIE